MPEMLSTADRLGRVKGQAIVREHMRSFSITDDSPFYRKVLGWGI